MPSFQLAHSTQPDWQDALDECLQQLRLDTEATLGFIYLTDPLVGELGKLMRRLRDLAPAMHWVGSVGTAVLCTGREFYDEAALVMLVTDLPREAMHVFGHTDELEELDLTASALNVGVVHGDPRNPQLPEIIAALPDTIGNGYLVGGLSSSQSWYYQIADGIHEGGLSGVLFDDRVQVVTGLTQGCSPIGPVHELTECDGNVAIRIDERPALDVLREDIGEVLARDLSRIGGYIFAGFPISGDDTGDYLVRNLIGFDPEHGVVGIGDYLQAGTRVMFCRRDGESATADLRRMLGDIHARASGKILGGLYFSCLGRGRHLFGATHREMQIIAEELGDIPLAGFYANGEIAGNRLYGYTGVLVLFTRAAHH